MKRLIKFFKTFVKTLFNRRWRYVRFSPSTKGKIYLYDKKERRFFSIYIRDGIDSATVNQIFTHTDYDLSFLKRYDELLENYDHIVSQNKVPLIIDCGANIGCAALYFASVFPKSLIISIEPEKSNFSMMQKNCAGLGNVQLLNKAVGSADGFVRIDDIDSDNDAFRTSRSENGEGGIEVVTINSILSGFRNTVPFIVKIDIEGFEDDLFSANTGWVKKFPLLIIETHDWMLPKQANSQNFLKAISRHKRDFVHKGENIFSLAND